MNQIFLIIDSDGLEHVKTSLENQDLELAKTGEIRLYRIDCDLAVYEPTFLSGVLHWERLPVMP